MKIAGFGDSFIEEGIGGVPYGYYNVAARHFNAEWKSYGLGGTGTHYAFFEFLKYGKDYDVILFAWSNSLRIYNKVHPNICPTGCLYNKDSDDPIWQAATQYYSYLHDDQKVEIEFTSFYFWLDHWLAETYPDKKFIHMWGFPKLEYSGDAFQYWKKPENIKYYHRFKNSVEIRPALINLSLLDEWPVDGDLSKETRNNHLSLAMQNYLGAKVIYAIENYKPGLLVE